jgi:NADH-quinone oxidoreductase subunit A
MPDLLAYVLLFGVVAAAFIFIHLMIGKLVRPSKMDDEKGTIYECGEPTIGTSWIQFDLRFYVVALLFVVFDVEMAFFFPWAVVFGRVTELSDAAITAERRVELTESLVAPDAWKVSGEVVPANGMARRQRAFRQAALEDVQPMSGPRPVQDNISAAQTLAWIAFGDILVFFGVLLVGFAYLWKRGDLDWVRSYAAQNTAAAPEEPVAG